MYLPAHFQEERLDVLHQFIRRHGFATLVTLGPDGLTANHIPFLLDTDRGTHGTLRGHVARSNPLWKASRTDMDSLAVFQGAYGYISPSLYPTKAETGKVVPTWNYAVVHAYGPLCVIDDTEWLRTMVTDLTNHHESVRARPWAVTDAPGEFVDRMLKAIVGIEIPISRLEGKWKVSQNRPPKDRSGVVAGLRAGGDEAGATLAELVAAAENEPAKG
jgi:transcriptional regulator